MLGHEIEGRILAARADAAAAAGLYEEAERFFVDALRTLPGRLSPEPLVRLYLLQDELVKARQVFDEYEFPSGSEEEVPIRLLLDALESGRKPSLKSIDRVDEPDSPETHLYHGLLLNLASKGKKAVPYLQESLSRGRWGGDLASAVLIQLTSPDCAMCRSGKATTHWDGAPVCQPCDRLLANESWRDQAFLQPTSEQKRLLENVLGENASLAQELFVMNTPKEMQVKVGFSPALETDELVVRLGSECAEAWSRAETLSFARGRKALGIGDLGLTLLRGFEEARSLFTEESARLFLLELELRAEEEAIDEDGSVAKNLRWVLNVASWLNKNLPPFSKNGISIRDLVWALDLTRASPGTGATGMVSSLIGDRLGAEQRDYFEDLVGQRPNCLFLRSVLSGRSRYDFRPESYQQSLRHRLWFINNRPSVYPRHTIDNSPADDCYEIVKAWTKSIQAFADDPYVLATAADVFSLEDRVLILALRCRCTCLQPQNTDWKMRLAIELDYLVDDDHDQTGVARLHLQIMKPYLDEASEVCRAHILPELSLAIFDAEGPERCKDHARELLAIAEKTSDWNTANAWHKAHTLMGLLAIQEGDLQRGREHLLQSAQNGESPQLRSLGPNMRLAMALLEAGEWNVVGEFLEQCSNFWDSDELDCWTDQVEDREMPFFEFNLWY